jgi:hypothetical protein
LKPGANRYTNCVLLGHPRNDQHNVI